MAATNFDSLADEDWRFVIDECELNSPTICYPDPDRPRAFVGPLVAVNVGSTVESEEGEEVLEIDGADGRNLAAVACLPQFADLFRWARHEMGELDPLHFDSQSQHGRFMRELRERIEWIVSCIDDREATMGAGMHAFERFRNAAKKAGK